MVSRQYQVPSISERMRIAEYRTLPRLSRAEDSQGYDYSQESIWGFDSLGNKNGYESPSPSVRYKEINQSINANYYASRRFRNTKAGRRWRRTLRYRTVEEMAEYLVEDPDTYENDWENFIKVR